MNSPNVKYGTLHLSLLLQANHRAIKIYSTSLRNPRCYTRISFVSENPFNIGRQEFRRNPGSRVREFRTLGIGQNCPVRR